MPEDRGASADAVEEWRPVPGHEGFYELSNLGNVRSLHFDPPRPVSTRGTDKDGYPVVALTRGPYERSTYALHPLVCTAFHGRPSAPGQEAAHLDGVRTNARADNLEWTSKKENQAHRRIHGTDPAGERHPNAKLSTSDVVAIRRARGSEFGATLAARFGVSRSTIYDIWQGKSWAHDHAPESPQP